MTLTSIPVSELPAAPASTDPLHAWVAAKDAAALAAWADQRIAAQQAAVASLLSVQGARTLDNTLRPFDEAANQLALASSQSHLLYAVGDTPELRDMGQALAQKISAIAAELSLDPNIYTALCDLAASPDAANWDAATRHYLQRTLLQYRLSGVDKDEPTRNYLRALQDRATELSLSFGRHVQDDVRSVIVKDRAQLDGLPQDFLDRHPVAADGTCTVTTDQPDYGPVLRYAKSDALRRELFLAYNDRGYPANKQVLLDLLTVRAEIASILGFATWADLATADQMMGSAANMKKFLAEVDAASSQPATDEYAQLMAWVQTQRPDLKVLTDADAGYWAEQFRRAAYDFDSQSVRPYFPYEQVETGILATAARLFHVEFRAVPDAVVWDKSVTTFDVIDHGRAIGRIYLDMHPRPGKDKWFSASSLVPGIRYLADNRQLPEGVLICNFPGGELAGDPGLMEYNDVVTYFHEFGHLMHYILGGQQQWSGIGGFSVEGDFIEVPSQMLEEFFREPAILQSFAKHYQTGEPLPTELIAQMNRANAYGRGRWVQTQLFYTNFALDVHDRDPKTLDLDALLRQDHDRFLKPAWIDGNRMYACFTHLTGYSSNYYTYVFDKVIAIDFFAQFDQKDLLDGPAAMRYRKAVLEPGGGRPAEELVDAFLGRKQNMDALREWIAAGQRS
jgi:thimet oligopeptidase